MLCLSYQCFVSQKGVTNKPTLLSTATKGGLFAFKAMLESVSDKATLISELQSVAFLPFGYAFKRSL